MADLRPSTAARATVSDNVLRAFLASPAMMAVTRFADGTLIDANDAFLKAGALTRDEAIGRAITALGIWDDDSRRLEYRRQLETGGRVEGFEARFRNRLGVVRDMLINAEVVDIEGERCVVVVAFDVSERRRREREQAALYLISEAAHNATNLQELFLRIHRILAGLMPAKNFFISRLNADRTEVSFPLFIDEVTAPPPPRPHAKYLSDYVIRTAQPLLLRHHEVAEFQQRTGYAPRYGWCKVWLGAPLIIDGQAVGTITVQDYQDANAYREEDVTFFTFVASQVAAALQRYEARAARERSEALQRESQDYFTKSFHASPALMAIASLETGKIIEANEAFLRASGFTRPEVVGRTSLDLGLWADPQQRAKVMADLRATGAVHGYESMFLTKQGEPRYVLLNADAFEHAGKAAMLITAIDLTDRRRREQVQDATYRISRAVLSGGDLHSLFAEVHRIISGLMPARNFYIARLSADGKHVSFPYFSDEHDGGQPRTPPSRALGLGFTEHIIRTGRPVLITQQELSELLRREGDYQPPPTPPLVRMGAPLLLDGRPMGALALHDYANVNAYDADDLALVDFVAQQAAAAIRRREAEEALRMAEQQYRGIFENALEGLYQSTPEGRFLRANLSMARLLGYASVDELLSAINDIEHQLYVDPRRREEFLELIRQSDTVPDFESEIRRPDGTTARICESVRAVRNAQGVITHFEGVAIDVTATHERARALRAAKDAADEASRAKTQFLASMSHELRTPLNGILGYTQILRRDPALNDKQRSGVNIIHTSAEHLLALINDVLDLAKIEARKLELHPSEFGLAEFGQNVAEVFSPRAREKNLRLETAFATDLPRTVVCDAQRLRQVLFNLLSNAVKFTQVGGVVFSIERAGPAVRFSVSDSGPGIAEQDQAKLFEPFAQLGDQGQRSGGTGLGLNVSRSILEQMGSQLHLESRPGWGTRFWFDLTLREGPGHGAVGTATPWRITGYAGPRRRVLVADDHAPNRALLVDLLQPLGFEVVTADDGVQAVQLAREWKPHLALLDVRMPRMDGLTAARLLRAELGPEAPCIIGISASAHDEQQSAALAAGCAAFIAKPFRDDDLFNLIGRHLGLTWRQADPPGGAETAAPFPALPHPPSPAQAEHLFQLASGGDVLAVRAYVQQLATDDPQLAAFAQQVTDLAARFKMKAIRSLVTRYRTPPAVN